MSLSQIFKTTVVASCVAMASFAQANSLEPAIEAGQKINQSAEKSQQKIDKISDDIQARLQQFKAINKEIEGLLVYNRQLEKQVANQEAEMADINESIDKVSVVERQVTPLMIRMIDGLEQFVRLDVPFLPEERTGRIADLKSMMDRADITPSEKFRRVLEAYQVEVDYGKTIEAYTSTLEVEGEVRDVDFLRVGRVALIYQTRDGKFSGAWDKNQNDFVGLSPEYRTQITKGLRIARKQLAPDLLVLPVSAAE
ncbi:TonB system biopolymer transport component [Catenovulum agarivorans DS-2]|uniref:TonB system biopolymer transport component n=1 Tax=Catenovulum agarivorans DS-2 TaxID=1328313 RepID=W7QF40_9ALTE|nr:DUF3450 domain-containing protein [Catenovulum agarivorans]EWH11509.1 TonB system biopolymer transport component [Catenovulum agarivorans DS-2]